MDAKWNLFIDVEKCNGCRNCFVAVKDEYVGNSEPGYFAPQPVSNATWFSVEHHERGRAPFTQVTYVPKTCRHCDDAPCLKAATGGAVEKRADGIVLIHPEKAGGQKSIVAACPYGAVVWNEELSLPQAWPFDAHLLDGGWKRTRVEQVCPTGALKSEKLADGSRSEKLRIEGWCVPDGEEATRPRVFYRGLERLDTRLVAGTVTGDVGGRTECLEGARVSLVLESGATQIAMTDSFGDFRFEAVPHADLVHLKVECAGYSPYQASIEPEVNEPFGIHLRSGAS